MQYAQYLQTTHWKETRDKRVNEHRWCSVCKETEKLQVHHKRYSGRDGGSLLFKEQPSILVPLCSSCHRLVHHYFGINVIKLNKKICRVRRLMELGVLKNKAFWVVSNPDLYESIYKKIK